MSSVRILRYAYLVLGAYAVVLVPLTSLELIGLVPALLQLLLCGLLFALGYSLSKGERSAVAQARPLRSNWSTAMCLTLGPAVVAASIATAQYYTGMTPATVLSHLQSSQSLYSNYQGYNEQLVSSGGGGGFTIWFALLVFKNAATLIAIFSIISRGGRILPQELVLLVLVIAAQAYSGTARGTGLEFFQVGSALLFALLSRPRAHKRHNAQYVHAIVIGLALASLYVVILTARGSGLESLDLGNDVELEHSWVSDAFGPGLVGALLSFYNYFGFGSYYVSTYWTEIWMADPLSLLLGTLPGGLAGDIAIRAEMAQLLDIGTRWHPDSILLASSLGMLGLFGVCLLLGLLARRLEARSALSAMILRYFIFLQMLAFPVGNFVWVDTATWIIVLWIVMLQLVRAWGWLPPTFGQFFNLRPRDSRGGRDSAQAAGQAGQANGPDRDDGPPASATGLSR